ncbi:bridge-like lipid transfer protein family member 3A [Ascaphus truei]|uniref:bridge-like lipid transfer protein family member 3A n=1 Tax=Ascaphus truei TaxID=8439 RepID=UPI003F5A117B
MVMSSQMSLLLDDLLWVLTDSQLRALLTYTKSLSEAIQRSARQRKEGAGGQAPPSLSSPPPWSLPPPPPSVPSSISQYFDKFDVKETSYHLLISRLDLHICDESQARGTGSAEHRVSGGAIQLTLHRITLDYYPSHRAGQSCAHWHRVSPAMGKCEKWVQNLAEERQAREEEDGSAAAKAQPWKQGPGSEGISPPSASLFSSSVLIRVDDLDIHQVSSSGHTPQKPQLLSCGRVPPSCSAIHLQYTEYYRPPGENLPVPYPALYIQLHSLLLCLAAPSVLWLNLFLLDLSHRLQQFVVVSPVDSGDTREHRDVLLHGYNFKLSLPVPPPPFSTPERPHTISVLLPSLTLTNTRQTPCSSLPLLQNTFRTFAAHPPFHWPPGPLSPLFLSHAFPPSSPPSSPLWTLHCLDLSLYFEGGAPRPQELLRPLSLTAWTCNPQPKGELQVLLNVKGPARVQLNHYHYLTLLRAQEQLRALLVGLQSAEQPPVHSPIACIGVLAPGVTLSLLLPPTSPDPPQPEESERSSLLESELVEGGGGSEEEGLRGSPDHDQVRRGSPNHKEARRRSPDQEEAQSEGSAYKEARRGDSSNEDPAQDALQGPELARDTLLSTLGSTRDALTLGKERMQRFLKDTGHKENDAPHSRLRAPLSRTQSQQSLDALSVEGLDLMSLDSESSNGFVLLLDADISSKTTLHQTETVGNGDTASSERDDASQSTDGPEPQQILVVALDHVTSVLHLRGDDVSVTLQAADICCGPRTGDSARSEGPSEAAPPSSPSVLLKFDLGPSAAHLSPLASHNGFLQLWIRGFSSEIPVSALTHLGPFLEDDNPPEILPMTIRITHSSVTLRDDGPRLYPSPLDPEPVTLALQGLKVHRRDDGVFCITGGDGSDHSLLHQEDESEELSQSKEELQRELAAARTILEQQREQQQRLLQEIQRHDPHFQL